MQFKYGNTWQFEYRLEDKIEWGGNDIGKPNQYKVMVYGILESDICPNCFSANYNEEYDIYIEEDIIRRITIMKSIENYFSEDGDFIILNK